MSPSLIALLMTPMGHSALAAEALVLQGVPEIPGELIERLNQYENTRWASLASLSDDAQRILVSTRLGDTNQVHLVDHPGGARTQITFRPEPSRGGDFVPGDNGALLFSGDIGGNEQHQIFRFDMRTGQTTRLTDSEARNRDWMWSRAGDRLAFSSNARNGRDFDIWTSDGRTEGSAALLAPLEGHWYPLDWGPEDDALLIGQWVSRADTQVHWLDTRTGAHTRLFGGTEDDAGFYGDVRFGADRDTLFVTAERDGEFNQLFRVTRDGDSWRWKSLTADIPWDVREMAMRPDGGQLAFIVNAGGMSALYLLDAETDTPKKVAGIPPGILYGLDFAVDAPVLGFSAAGATRTGDAWTLNLDDHTTTRWTQSEIGGLDASRFVEPTLIEYTSFDGLKIPAFYYRPPGDGPFPVKIDIHGGPEGQARPYFSALRQFLLTERNVAVLVPNVRGSSGYGKTYLTLDNGFKREDSVKDIGALLDWVAEQPELDASRVAVAGGSYGGYMVLAALVHYGDRLKAGVDMVGISNFVTFLENTKDYRRDLRRVEYGDERDPEMRAFLEAISPSNHADKIRSALLVGQGANDPRVPLGEAEQIVQAVTDTGQHVWYVMAPDEGHGFRKKPNRDAWTRVQVLFLETHLIGEDPEEGSNGPG
jgi:dipeptidyl aminopeptidase/acylaminoacyl peptidase